MTALHSLPLARSSGLLLASLSLAWREWVRFLRQRNRVVGALVTPILFWLLIGAGIGRSFNAVNVPGGTNFLEFFFPGTILMILLFTAIFSTISIIEDRREGFLQSVLVAPTPRLAIVLGKVIGGSALALVQATLFLAIAPLLGISLSFPSLLGSLAVMTLLAVSLSALGFCLAWRMSSTQGFHAIMNLLLMPMWFLSGALFPSGGSWNPLAWLMAANPLTYGLAALRRTLYPAADASGLPGMELSLIVTVVFTILMLLAATRVARTGATVGLP